MSRDRYRIHEPTAPHFLAWIGVWLLLVAMPLAWGAERMALVIGNAQYSNERPLINTLNDARAVAEQLRGLGFEVALHENLAAIPMRREINRYLEEVKGREGTVLFYYSGHGMQDRYRASYLIPVDAKVTGQEDIVAYGVGLNDILEKMGERPRNAVSLVIVDACRDNPFASQRGGKGLGRVDAGRGTLVLYAAGPGQTADDRPNESNGLFTQHLLKVLPQPGLDLEDAFDRVAEAVERASNGHQVPYKEGDLRGKFYLAGAASAAPPTTPPATPPTVLPATSNDDQTLWQSAERCGTAACFQAYLNQYPNGRFAAMAKARLQPQSPPPVVPETPPRLASKEPPASIPAPVELPPAYPTAPTPTRSTTGPSFDCRKAQYESERLICASARVSSLDVQMANAYRSVESRLAPQQRSALRKTQDYWLRQVRDRCLSEACLVSEYNKRIEELTADSGPVAFQDAFASRGEGGPSFDCRKAQYESERMVCASAELSRLDRQMAETYRATASGLAAESRAALRKAQDYWLRQIRDRCQSEACLASEYRNRIRELEAYYR
ncbi:MAG TPA: caspase family protein [Candidatus Contendobacter sp.]|nr:caspase family protein [Candidatus Competibacteraceae bacterium]HRZ52592.1 caspase family protein [Candidatus Contendobacter sp.]